MFASLMMPSRRPAPPPAGIYELAGTIEGKECWIAYDDRGECKVLSGDGAYQQLEQWLSDHGIDPDSPRPALFLT